MRILVVGSGREHALAWKLVQSRSVEELHAAPGNPGIAQTRPLPSGPGGRSRRAARPRALARRRPRRRRPGGAARRRSRRRAPSRRRGGVRARRGGRADRGLQGVRQGRDGSGRRSHGASSRGAAGALRRQGRRSRRRQRRRRLPHRRRAYAAGLERGRRRSVATLLVEELLEGPEVSLFALCDGRDAVPLPPARTSSAPSTATPARTPVAWAPTPGARPQRRDDVKELVERVHRPVLRELAARGTPFVGLLYAGLMLTPDGPRVLEFNCRFGDPETQSVLPLVDGDLAEALHAAAVGDLRRPSTSGRRPARPSPSSSPPATTLRPATAAHRSTGSRRPRRPVRSSSTPARHSATVCSSRTAVASSP